MWITTSVVVAFTGLVETYSLRSLESEPAFTQMVANAYKVTLACAFVSLAARPYWIRASNLGVGLAIVLGHVIGLR